MSNDINKTLNAPVVDLIDYRLESDHAKIFTEQFAKTNNVLPIHLDGSRLMVAVTIDNDNNLELSEEIRRSLNLSAVAFVVAPQASIESAIRYLYSDDFIEDPDVHLWIRTSIHWGIHDGASEIIIEPVEEGLSIKFLIDGVIHENNQVPTEMTKQFIDRTKMLANMDFSIRDRAQESSMSVIRRGVRTNLRVNTSQVPCGEKITFSVLDQIANIPLAGESVTFTVQPDEPEPPREESDAERFIRSTILQGIIEKASHIVFEPEERHLIVRYRIDGVLHDIAEIPATLSTEIVAYIKISSNMDFSIRKSAQEGSISVVHEGAATNFRVKTLPVAYGEQIVFTVV